jgi:hypothetical protein
MSKRRPPDDDVFDENERVPVNPETAMQAFLLVRPKGDLSMDGIDDPNE